jgi:ribonuclease-3
VEALRERLKRFGIEDDLLRQSLAHRSWCAEKPAQPSNERLELLGDAVVGLVITDHLYRSFPDLSEGDLARVKAAVVSMPTLAPVAAELGLGAAVLLGKGEDASGGREKPSILADTLEAVIGAVYLASGYEGAAKLVLSLLGDHARDVAAEARLGDPKNRLQELAAQLHLDPPTYLMRERGPDHAKHFTAEAVLGRNHLGRGQGRSKREAERRAAVQALAVLEERTGPPERKVPAGDA